MKLNFGTLLLAIVVLGFLMFRYVWKLAWTPWQIVGVAIFVPAFLLFVLARIELGRAFSIKAKANTLVTTGLYARIRNPIYVFGGLMSLGIFIFLHRPWLLLIWVPLIPLQVSRVRKEEQVLEAKFGDAYREVQATDVVLRPTSRSVSDRRDTTDDSRRPRSRAADSARC